MPKTNRIKQFWLTHLSKPRGDRVIYRAMRRHRPAHLLALGLGDGMRVLRMLDVALGYLASHQVRLTGIDLFEARPAGQRGLSLKQAYQLLRAKAARVQLIPGDPLSALARAANAIHAVDLVVLSADQFGESLDRAWFYVPRMLSVNAKVLIERLDAQHGTMAFAEVSRQTLDERAATLNRKRAA